MLLKFVRPVYIGRLMMRNFPSYVESTKKNEVVGRKNKTTKKRRPTVYIDNFLPGRDISLSNKDDTVKPRGKSRAPDEHFWQCKAACSPRNLGYFYI